jgi:hypothetical protein
MRMENEMKCVIAGSFSKFKPEIDLAIEECQDLGVVVLEPQKGWLYKDPRKIFTLEDRIFRPLPNEKEMTASQIEDTFLNAIVDSDFLYVVCPEGYVGSTVSMELGFSLAHEKPIYSNARISDKLDLDPMWKERIKQIKVMSIEDAIKNVRNNLEDPN